MLLLAPRVHLWKPMILPPDLKARARASHGYLQGGTHGRPSHTHPRLHHLRRCRGWLTLSIRQFTVCLVGEGNRGQDTVQVVLARSQLGAIAREILEVHGQPRLGSVPGLLGFSLFRLHLR